MGVWELLEACQCGDLEVVKAEVKRGADPKEKDVDGLAGIHHAARAGNCTIIKHLLEQCGVGVDDKYQAGKTALYLATYNGHEDVVRMLVDEFGADMTIKDDKGETVLDLAILFKQQRSE